MTDASEPTIIDAAIAVGEEGKDILNLIFAHQQREQEAMEDHILGFHAERAAKDLMFRHAVASALGDVDWGGTTRDYDKVLLRIEAALRRSHGYWDEVYLWYKDQFMKAFKDFDFWPEIPVHEIFERDTMRHP